MTVLVGRKSSAVLLSAVHELPTCMLVLGVFGLYLSNLTPPVHVVYSREPLTEEVQLQIINASELIDISGPERDQVS